MLPAYLNLFSLINRAKLIGLLKLSPQFAAGGASTAAIVYMFTIQAESGRVMGLPEQGRLKNSLSIGHQIINGQIRFGPIHTRF